MDLFHNSLYAPVSYFGLMDVVKIKKEDAVVVSGAAGAVSSMAVQIAKKVAVGCKKMSLFSLFLPVSTLFELSGTWRSGGGC